MISKGMMGNGKSTRGRQWPKEKQQIMIHKTIHRKIKIERQNST